MQLVSGGTVIPLPAAGPGQSHAGVPGKFDFYCSKGHRLAYYLFIFHEKFSAICNFYINSNSKNNHDSWFFSFLKNICS